MGLSLGEQSQRPDYRERTFGEGRLRSQIVAAALHELQMWSFDRFSVESVAHRAEVDPAEVHRLWKTPEQLMIDAVVDHGREVVCFPDTGCMRRDLSGHLATLAAYANTVTGRSLLRKAVIDPKNWAPADVRGQLWSSYVNAARVTFERAERRNEIRPGHAVGTVLQMAIGPLCLRTLYAKGPIDTVHLSVSTADFVWQAMRHNSARR